MARLGLKGTKEALRLVAAGLLTLAFVSPAGAQFDRRGGGLFESIFGGFGAPQRRPMNERNYPGRDYPGYERAPTERPAERPVDSSKAPSTNRRVDANPANTILILGDSMADWLAYGLEDTLSDAPESAIIRKNRVSSGLIRYESRSETPDWSQVAREALAADKPTAIVVMLGLNDRQPIRERTAATPTRPGASAPAPMQPEPAEEGETPTTAEAPIRGRAGAGAHEFRSERWAELYGQRIDTMITVLKSRGVPVFWMGLPSVRGTRSTGDMSYLNDLFRARAEKAGIVFVDVWDGFVDEAGRFALQGPDFEGQTRRLRTADGVHFTRAGARKLGHYLDREIKRAAQPGPVAVALPTSEPQTQQPGVKIEGGTARPLAGPVMPLTSEIAATNDLLGAPNVQVAAAHVTATRVLVKGEALNAPAGRSDDFAWPRRGVGAFGTDPVVAMTTLPLPDMKPPPARTVVATPAEVAPPPKRPAVAAVQRPRADQPAERERSRGFAPFSFFPFFR